MIPYGKQNITEEDIQAVVKALKGDFLTQGPTILEFEKAFANYIGCQYAVAVSNGTAALHLSALALDVKEGDKVTIAKDLRKFPGECEMKKSCVYNKRYYCNCALSLI